LKAGSGRSASAVAASAAGFSSCIETGAAGAAGAVDGEGKAEGSGGAPTGEEVSRAVSWRSGGNAWVTDSDSRSLSRSPS
jgi:hypothetical protein